MKKEQAFESVKAYLPRNKEIIKIIEVCDLYPMDDSWKKWTDHLGSYIHIFSKKNIKSFIYSPFDKSERIVTDLYFKSHPNKISEISKWAFISFGKDSSVLNICFLWLLGKDNRLRLLSYSNGKWQKNYPPLISGIDTLHPIIKYLNVNSYKKVDILRIKGPVASNMTRSWVTVWPPCKKLKQELLLTSKELGNAVNSIIRR